MRLANEYLSPFEPTNRLERQLARPLLHTENPRLRAIVQAAPTWVTKDMLSASDRIADRRPAMCMSHN